MITGILEVELFIPESGSLKHKRSAVKSIKERVRTRFNVSIAEVEHTELWQRATLGIACVSNETQQVDRVLSNVLNLIDGDRRVEVLRSNISFV